MYTAVLMLAMTTSAESADFGRRGGGGCNGGYGGYAGCYGGGSYGGCGGGMGYYGGGCGGSYGGCGGGMGYYGGGGGYYRAGGYSPSYYGPNSYVSGNMYAPSNGSYVSGNNFYPSNGMTQGQPSNIRQSFYTGPNQQSATIRVLLPDPNAQVWFDATPTQQQGMERVYSSPSLDAGNYKYTVKAQFMENGRKVDRERSINVQQGQAVTVDFRNDNPGNTQNLQKNNLDQPVK